MANSSMNRAAAFKTLLANKEKFGIMEVVGSCSTCVLRTTKAINKCHLFSKHTFECGKIIGSRSLTVSSEEAKKEVILYVDTLKAMEQVHE